ncbi:MAG: serine hydrolase domain-containing protein [Ornithinibacter sp.]
MTRPRSPARRGLLVAVGIVLAVGAASLGVNRASDSSPAATGDVYAQIDAYVADEIHDSRIPGGVVAVAENGKTVHANGFGTDGRGNPVTADTPFWIGSNTKSITALAVMQLVEDGVLDLDAPVQQYLPDFRVADPGASATITLRHLLNQTSGISRIDGIRAVARGGAGSMQDTVADMRELQLDRPVGQSFEYANLNSVVLGAVIEQVTGQSWQQYVDSHVFEPLGMDRTFTDQATADAAGLTRTYRSFFGFPLETRARHLDGLAASGYVYSTASDMSRYLAMYLDGGSLEGRRVVSKASVDEMLTPATGPRTFPLQSQQFTASYGAGWFVGSFGGVDSARWHQGSLPHFTAWMVLLPESGQGVVLMLNEGNQFEVAGANATWSRIPQGVVSLLSGNEAASGGGSTSFFIVVLTLLIAVATAQLWHLVALVRRGIPPAMSTARAAVPLIWELGLGAAMLLLYRATIGGLGWSATFAFLPDLTLAVVVLGGLALAGGAVRIALLTSRRTPQGHPESGDSHRPGAPAPPPDQPRLRIPT